MQKLNADQVKFFASHFFHQKDHVVFVQMAREGFLVEGYVDNLGNPQVIMLTYQDIVMLDGEYSAENADALINQIPVHKGILHTSPEWMKKMEKNLGSKVIAMTRFAMDLPNFDPKHLETLRNNLPAEYELCTIDRKLAGDIISENRHLTCDHVSQFGGVEAFLKHGFGFCILRDGKIVSLASTYAISRHGIEIQVNTLENECGRGLATAISAALLLESLMRGLVPHWDAANLASVKIAEKLGYGKATEYQAFVRIA